MIVLALSWPTRSKRTMLFSISLESSFVECHCCKDPKLCHSEICDVEGHNKIRKHKIIRKEIHQRSSLSKTHKAKFDLQCSSLSVSVLEFGQKPLHQWTEGTCGVTITSSPSLEPYWGPRMYFFCLASDSVMIFLLPWGKHCGACSDRLSISQSKGSWLKLRLAKSSDLLRYLVN